MNKTSTFDFMGIQLRVVLIDGNPWFVAQDICRALDVAVRADGSINTSMATAKLDASEKLNLPYQEAKSIGLKETASRAYGVTLISESGIYRMVMRCDKWEARAFQDWVTKVVLPAIRKDGAYIKDEEKVATGGQTLLTTPTNDFPHLRNGGAPLKPLPPISTTGGNRYVTTKPNPTYEPRPSSQLSRTICPYLGKLATQRRWSRLRPYVATLR